MTEILTKLCLAGAAVLFAAWLVVRCRGCFARVSDALAKIPLSHLAAFLFFVAVATVCAQKPDGTNEPPRSGNVELRMENVELRNLPSLNEGEQHHNSTLSILHSQLSIATNDSYSYVMSSNGVLYSKWWRRGGYEDVQRKCRI